MAKETFKDLANLLTERSSWILAKEYLNLMNGQFFYIVVKYGLWRIWRRNYNF